MPADGQSVFEAAEANLFEVVRYYRRWVYPSNPTKGDLRHVDHDLVLNKRPLRRFGILPVDANRNSSKWTVVPHRTPRGAQWRVHRIAGWLAAYRTSRRFSFRHHRLLSNGWKYDRADSSQHRQDLTNEARLGIAMAQFRWER